MHAARHTPLTSMSRTMTCRPKQFALGFDTHGRLLELAILTFDSGNRLVIHTMKARPHYAQLLE